MCRINLTIYPCNHTILTSHTPCAPNQNPLACNSRNTTVTTTYFFYNPTGLRILCPGCNIHAFRRGLLILPIPDPATFAHICVSEGINMVDAISFCPAWVFDLKGNKIGSRSRPWRVLDYVVALYRTKNPRSVQLREREAAAARTLPDRKRRLEPAGGQPAPAKRIKTDDGSSLTTVEAARDGRGDAGADDDLNVVVKVET